MIGRSGQGRNVAGGTDLVRKFPLQPQYEDSA